MLVIKRLALLVCATLVALGCETGGSDFGDEIEFQGAVFTLQDSHRGERDNFTTHRFDSTSGKIFIVELDSEVSIEDFMPLYRRYYEGTGYTGIEADGVQMFYNREVEILVTKAQGARKGYPVSFARRRKSTSKVFTDRIEVESELSGILLQGSD